MRVTLIRHGIAVDNTPEGGDGDRPLTAEGRAQVSRVAARLRRRGVRFDVLITSPLVRATQTAERFADLLQSGGSVDVSRALLPDEDPARATALLAPLPSGARVALVGHQPQMARLAAALLGLSSYREPAKGEALRIKLPEGPWPSVEGKGEVRWWVEPETAKLVRP